MSDHHPPSTSLAEDPLEHPPLNGAAGAGTGNATTSTATNGTAANGAATNETPTNDAGGFDTGGSGTGEGFSERRRGPGGPPPQTPRPRTLLAATIAVGVWHLVLAVATTLLTLLWWPVVEQTASSTVQWRGFTFTGSSGVLLLAIAGGSTGSLVHTISIFSSRVGRRTFETSYLWWYLLRPIGAVLLALIFVATVSSGLISLGSGDGGASAALSFIAGALAGLFTDAILQRLRGLLGATSTEQAASTQAVPLAPRPQG